MARHLDDIDNLLGGSEEACFTGLLGKDWYLILFNLFQGCEVQAYQCSVVVEVGVDGGRISIVFGQAEMLRQKHESTRNGVVDVPVAFPILAILVILRVIVWLGPVDMLQNHVEQMADEYGSSERGV